MPSLDGNADQAGGETAEQRVEEFETGREKQDGPITAGRDPPAPKVGRQRARSAVEIRETEKLLLVIPGDEEVEPPIIAGPFGLMPEMIDKGATERLACAVTAHGRSSPVKDQRWGDSPG